MEDFNNLVEYSENFENKPRIKDKSDYESQIWTFSCMAFVLLAVLFLPNAIIKEYGSGIEVFGEELISLPSLINSAISFVLNRSFISPYFSLFADVVDKITFGTVTLSIKLYAKLVTCFLYAIIISAAGFCICVFADGISGFYKLSKGMIKNKNKIARFLQCLTAVFIFVFSLLLFVFLIVSAIGSAVAMTNTARGMITVLLSVKEVSPEYEINPGTVMKILCFGLYIFLTICQIAFLDSVLRLSGENDETSGGILFVQFIPVIISSFIAAVILAVLAVIYVLTVIQAFLFVAAILFMGMVWMMFTNRNDLDFPFFYD